MQWKEPKNTDKYYWTAHAKMKMRHYGLSEQAVRRVIRAPERTEEGIVQKTIAVMKPPSARTVDGKRSWTQEVWVMYQTKKPADAAQNLTTAAKVKIISAWRYPGVSPHNNPIPEDILDEISELSL